MIFMFACMYVKLSEINDISIASSRNALKCKFYKCCTNVKSTSNQAGLRPARKIFGVVVLSLFV